MKKFLIPFMLIIALVLVACSGDNTNSDINKSGGSDKPKEGGTVIVGLSGDPLDFNPNAKGDDDAYAIHQNIFNRLLKLNNNQEVLPDLAKEYEISKDGLEVTFHLQESVKWHDGEPFSSEDVKFTFDTIIKENGQASGSLKAVKEITTPDENTVVFHLDRKDSSLIGTLSWYGIFIMPKHIYEGTDWTTNPANHQPVGTGPFKFVEHDKGVSITLERNEDYWGDVPLIDRVVFSIIPDANTAIQALNNGELDILGISPPFAEMEGFKNNPQLDYGEAVWPTRFQLAFNLKDKTFSDLKVRQAVAYGIDKQEIIQKALKGIGEESTTAMVPAFKEALNTDDVFPGRDVEKAKQLLEEAGYKADSEGIYFSTKIDVFSGEPFEDIATVIRENLAEVGIDVSINIMESAAWSDKVWDSKNYEMSLLAGYQGPGPGALVGRFTSEGSMNIYNYENKKVDEALTNATAQATLEESGPYYKEAQKYIVEDIPMLPLSEWISVQPYHNYIKGHPMSKEYIDKTGFTEFTYIWIDK
ncbi:MAG TPA: ABC transporter substrate-binding protein [Cerasibacillus sp.]|uniref:ABC transporter substrate-binding protein n=1 Tax=Cerasibacillus sp. TaxID=2498711 RepID=UPI002F3E63C9